MTEAPLDPPLLDPASIRELAAILAETGLTEIEIAHGDRRIRVSRAPVPMVPVAAAQAAATPALAAIAPAHDDAVQPGAVTSPMVGIAYLSADPGSPPFVTPGQAVTAGQTLLLIEAMKTFNQIKATRAGVVSQVLVASGEAVEYGQVLLIVE